MEIGQAEVDLGQVEEEGPGVLDLLLLLAGGVVGVGMFGGVRDRERSMSNSSSLSMA